MPFFEFDEGRLVPARLGHAVNEELDPEILQAVRDQVLEVVQRPLFPVSWYGDGRMAGSYRPGATAPRLTAMDASGQVVTVEVVDRLDSGALVAALSRSGRNADLGWAELSDLFPRGPEAFRREWNAFRESMPPRTAAGPRLVVVAATVDEEVRPALEVLGDSGVVVHEIALRRMSNGRQILEVNELRPDLVDVAGRMLTAGERTVEITAGEAGAAWDDAEVPEVVSGEAAAAAAGPRNQGSQDDTPPLGVPEPSAGLVGASGTVGTGGAHAADDSGDDAGGEAPGHEASEAPVREGDDESLAVIAGSLGADTPLVWHQLRRGVRYEATLTADGLIRLPGGTTFLDPDAAAVAASGRDDVDGWRVWRFGDGGPTLDDARTELAGAAARTSGQGRRSAR